MKTTITTRSDRASIKIKKITAIWTAVITTTLLVSCGGDSSEVVINNPGPQPLAPSSRIAFNPGLGILPVPNDILFAGTTDGTIQAPGEDEATLPEILGNPALAIGAVDGWSTVFPMQISVDLLDGATIDATTVSPSTVLMFEAITPPTSPLEEDLCQIPGVPAGQPCGVAAPLVFGVDFVAVSGVDSIAIAPLGPLDNSTTYVVALAPGILDSTGAEILGSEFYELVTTSSAEDDLGGDVGSIQDIVNLYEAVVAVGTGGNPLAADDMIFSAAWTTGSSGTGILAATGVLAQTIQADADIARINSLQNVGGSPVVVSVEQALIGAGVIDPSLAGATPLSTALLMEAVVTLPYYSGTPADGSDPILNGWAAQCDNALATAASRAAGLTPVEPNNTVCSTINPALGDFGADPQRFVTQFNPVPVVRDTPTIGVQITVPDAPAPAEGWPVVILQHGITATKEVMLGLAGALSANGFATLAIDHPLHGSRGLASAVLGRDANASSPVDPNDPDGPSNATDYLNLAFLVTGQSNLNQSMADLLALRLAIGISPELIGAGFDVSSVQFVGHSLGSISGTGFIDLANQLDAAPEFPLDMAIERGVLSVPGSGIAAFLLDSASFGDLVIESVLAGAGLSTSDSVELVNSILAQFVFAAQTVIDGADPHSFAASLAASGTPIYMNEVVGGETVTDLPDQVIPNQSSFAGLVFGGTEPLAAAIGLENVDNSNSGAESGIVRFDQGTHGSLLNGDVSTAEMQAQTIAFLSGMGIVVSDSSVILGQ